MDWFTRLGVNRTAGIARGIIGTIMIIVGAFYFAQDIRGDTVSDKDCAEAVGEFSTLVGEAGRESYDFFWKNCYWDGATPRAQ